MFQLQPLVIWTLFQVHHQKDIKQDASFKIRSQAGPECALFVSACVCSVQYVHCSALKFTQTYFFFLMKSPELTEMIIMFRESAFFFLSPLWQSLALENITVLLKL